MIFWDNLQTQLDVKKVHLQVHEDTETIFADWKQ